MNYLGKKEKLNDFIFDTIKNFIEINNDYLTNERTFFDLFTGTSSVAKYWKNREFNVSANDIQFYSFVKANSLLNNFNVRKIKIQKIIDKINLINCNDIEEGFITKNYSPFNNQTRTFFTIENAKIIDYSISLIKENFKDKKINKNEKYFLIAKLIDSASKVSNTAVVFEAYLKSFKPTALKKITLVNDIDLIKEKTKSKVYNEDINILISKVKGDILYLDPPYNSRGYDSNYHLLETISLGDEPEIKNVSGKRVGLEKKSSFTAKRTAKDAMTFLLENAKFQYVFISYNNEGIISPIEFINLFEKNKWIYKIYKKKYKRFKSSKIDGPKYVEEIIYAIKKY